MQESQTDQINYLNSLQNKKNIPIKINSKLQMKNSVKSKGPILEAQNNNSVISQIIFELVHYITNLNFIMVIQNIIFFVCYAYLIYYTVIHLSNPVKYYINLSHNLLKWILVVLLSNFQFFLNLIFRYEILSKIVIMILVIAITHPSKQIQKIHLKLVIRKKDQQYQYKKDHLEETTISLNQKLLISISTNLIDFADWIIKLINPINRIKIVHMLERLGQTVSSQKYFWSIYENKKQNANSPNIINKQAINIPKINLTNKRLNINQTKLIQTMYIDKEKDYKDQLKEIENAIREGDNKIMKNTTTNIFKNNILNQTNLVMKKSLPEGVLESECIQIAIIGQNQYKPINDTIIRFYLKRNELEIITKQTLKTEKYIINQFKVIQEHNIVQFIFWEKSRLFKFTSQEEMTEFLNPIISQLTT